MIKGTESKTVPRVAEQNITFHQVRPLGNALLLRVPIFGVFPPLGKGLGSREESAVPHGPWENLSKSGRWYQWALRRISTANGDVWLVSDPKCVILGRLL